MYLRGLLTLCLLCICWKIHAQKSLDGEFKKEGAIINTYALFLPQAYEPHKPISVVVAFHPLNTQKWTAASWRDALRSFASRNQVFLICPDAGSNGRADDPKDIEFAARLTRAILKKYQLNPTCLYTLGASWGSRAAIKFALAQRDIVDGAILFANNLTGELLARQNIPSCQDLPIFLIQGKQDFLYQRLYPIQEELRNLGACVKAHLVPGEGHEMSIESHAKVMDYAIQWLDNIRCERPTASRRRSLRLTPAASDIKISQRNKSWVISMPSWKDRLEHIRVYDETGILHYIIYPKDLGRPLILNEANTYRVVAKVGNHLVHKTISPR